MADGWSRLTESVRTGQTAAEIMRHEGIASLWSRDPGAMEIFRSVMGTGPVEDYDAIVDACELGDSKVCADLGGGAGALMMSILDRYPQVHGILVERPGTIKNAEQRFTDTAYASRSALVSGDLSHEVPSGADVYLLKHVLHGYRDEEAEEILRSCRQAMRVTARLMMIEFVMPEVISSADPRIAQRAMSDLTMLAITRGRERTLAEWSGLLRRSGFVLKAVRNVADGSLSVIEAKPVVDQKDPPHSS